MAFLARPGNAGSSGYEIEPAVVPLKNDGRAAPKRSSNAKPPFHRNNKCNFSFLPSL